MRYVIVSVVDGEAGVFNNTLRKKVYEDLGARSSKLPAHFTIKAPFEYDGSILQLQKVLEDFVKKYNAKPYLIRGYDHFDERVIYMKVEMSKEGCVLHNDLIDALETLPFIRFGSTEGKDPIFHVTVSSKKIQPIFKELWTYVQAYPCEFECMYNNISLYKWEDETWKLVKRYE